MSHAYQAVGWSPQKRKYDLLIALCMVVYLCAFTAISLATQPHITFETLLLRATGSLAFVMLSFILLLGPLARMSPRFLPVLYNRRHLGVATFLAALVHGAFATLQFHALGEVNPLASVLSSDGSFTDGGAFPFQPLGAIVLGVLFLMAATSHDFWLANLTPRVWKGLHMAVYGAYAVLLGHVALGALQGEGKGYLWPVTGAVALTVFALHLYTGLAERRRDRADAARASGDPHATPASAVPNGLRPHRCSRGRDPRRRGPGGTARRRACRRLPQRHRDLLHLERLPPPDGPARRRPDHRRLRHLPLARLPVRSRDRLRSPALRRPARDL